MRTLLLILLPILLNACKAKTNSINQKPNNSSSIQNIELKSVIENGEVLEHYSTGVVKTQGNMKKGKRDGVWKSFYESGLPWSETTFSNGMKNGKTTTWFDNNKKRYEGYYTNDKESGSWTFWNEQGEIVNRTNYN